MKVNRVFCYSKDMAQQNGNKLPILPLVLITIIFLTAVLITSFLMPGSIALILLEVLVLIIGIACYGIILGLRLRARLIGWATTDDNRIFRAMTVNNGQGLLISGMSAGRLIDQLANNSNNLGRNLGGTVGAVAQFYSMDRSAQYMSHPEIVAKMVEEAPNITGGEVIEILKVHSIIEKKHSIIVNCDYKVLRKDRVKYNKNVNIEKSYNQLKDLINIINTHM